VTAAAHWMHPLKHGFESEIGIRYLLTPQADKTIWLGVAGITKYWKNYLFNFKLNLVKGTHLAAQSYGFNLRRYAKDDISYLGMSVGVAQTQEDSFYNHYLYNEFRTGTQWLSLSWHQRLNLYWSFDLGAQVEQYGNEQGNALQRQTTHFRINKLF
jgi:YaiO family outer membrane protein